MKVTVYSTSTCPICKQLKQFLEEKNVAFDEKKVDADEMAMKEMMVLSGGRMGVPFVTIDKDGVEEKILGFDRLKLTQLLGV